MTDRRYHFPMPGVSSLLTIFSVLCLTVFALLSISSVRSRQTLSDVSHAAVAGYYSADAAAEEILARLRSGELPPGVTKTGHTYRYVCPISDTQQLEVEVEVTGTDYQILQWQSVSTTVWNGDVPPELWNGETQPAGKGG